MLKVKKIEKNGKILSIYFKIPSFSSFRKLNHQLQKYYDEDSSLETGIDITGKYLILNYVLRNKEDILPYIKNKEMITSE